MSESLSTTRATRDVPAPSAAAGLDHVAASSGSSAPSGSSGSSVSSASFASPASPVSLASRDRGATLAASQADLATIAVVANTLTRERIPLGLVGVLLLIAAWWTVTHLFAAPGTLGRSFAPDAALSALIPLVRDDHLLLHVLVSVRRVAIGMAWAVVIGVPVGLLVGRFRAIDRMLTPAFQFLRMISPLSWMPIAVMSLGVGDRSVYFLLAFAAVWPVIMNTAAGVTQLDKRWIQLGQSLAATRVEMLVHIYLPGIAAHVLTGLRLATGILWIVLVPAEMLGVSAGLGYLILDTRDRLDYAELTATIFVIGAIGFAIDALLRALYRRFVR